MLILDVLKHGSLHLWTFHALSPAVGELGRKSAVERCFQNWPNQSFADFEICNDLGLLGNGGISLIAFILVSASLRMKVWAAT